MKFLPDFSLGATRCYSVLLGAAIAIASGKTNATDFSTTNTDALTHFWSASERTNRPITVISFGDSMADSYRSPSYYLMNKLVNRFGIAGYGLNNYGNTLLWNLANGAVIQQPDFYWFSAYTRLPAASSVWWENQPTPGGVLADQAGIFYVRQTNGGAFRLLLSTNSGPWTTVLQLNGYHTQSDGQATNIALPLNRYRVRIESDTGTNLIIGPSLVATHSGGVHCVFVDWPGINLGQVTNVPALVREPIFAALKPDLILWHMKEPLDGLTDRMAECEHWWSNSAPNCDVVYIGTPWLSADTNTNTTIDQNTIVRNIALQYHRTYTDLMQPTISYPWLLTNSFMADGTHLNNSGGLYCANIMWDDLGFFALGLNRRVSLQRSGNQLQLSYNTSANAKYRLEVSTNLHDWSVAFTNPVATTTFTTNFIPPNTPAFYRLGLSPP